jgi:hypothetical protein
MTDVEIERLIVRIVGDATEYQKMLIDSIQHTDEAVTHIESATKRIEGFGESVAGFGRQALGALAMFGVATSLEGAFEKYEAFENQQIKLKAVIEMNGRAAEGAVEEYTKFAEATAQVSMSTKGQILDLVKQAETMGKTGEAAQNLVKQSMELAAAADIDPQMAMRLTAALESGNKEMISRMSRMIPALRLIQDDTERAAKAQQMMTSGTKILAEQAGAAGGQLQKMHASLAVLGVEVGGIVAHAIQPLIAGITSAANWFKNLDPIIRQVTVSILLLLGALAALPQALNLVYSAWNALISSFTSIGAVVSFLFTPMGIALAVIAAGLAIVGVAVHAVVESLGGWGVVWSKVKDSAMEAWAWIKDQFNDFKTWAKPVWDNFLIQVKQVWDSIKSKAGEAWQYLQVQGQKFMDWIHPALDILRAVFVVSWEAIKDGAATTWAYIQDNAVPAWNSIQNAVVKTTDRIKELWSISIGWVSEFVDKHRALTAAMAAIAASAVILYGAYQLVSFGVAQIIAGYLAMGGAKVTAIALWLAEVAAIAAWKLIVLTAIGVGAIFLAQLYFWNAILTLDNIALVMWAIGFATVAVAQASWAVVGVLAIGVAWLWEQAVLAAIIAQVAWNSGIVLSSIAAGALAIWTGISTAAIWLWNTAVAAGAALGAGFGAAAVAGTAALTTFSLSTVLANIGTWILNTSLAIMNIELGGVPIIIGVVVVAMGALAAILLGAAAAALALSGTFALIIVATTVVVSLFGMLVIAATGIWNFLVDINQTIEEMPNGPVRTIIALFGEWWDILQDVVRAAKVDMPLAWQIVKAAAKLALEEVKALLPPLWEYIKTGFDGMWEITGIIAQIKWKTTIAALREKLYELPKDMGKAFDAAWEYIKVKAVIALGGLSKDEEKAANAAFDAATDVGENDIESLKKQLDEAKKRLRDNLSKFPDVPQDNDAIKAARAEVDRLRSLIPEAELKSSKWFRDLEALKKKAEDDGKGLGASFNKGVAKEIGKLDFVAYGSAEAIHRINQYKEMLLGEGPEKKGTKHKVEGNLASQVKGAEDAAKNANIDLKDPKNAELRKWIDDSNKKMSELPNLDINAPKIEAPKLPEVQVKGFNWPPYPKWEWPKLPDEIKNQLNVQVNGEKSKSNVEDILLQIERAVKSTRDISKVIAQGVNKEGSDNLGLATGGLVDNSQITHLSQGGPVDNSVTSYLENGGDTVTNNVFKPKGTDTVPAMLTPNEFVVNKEATAKNLPLLMQINDNRLPSIGKLDYDGLQVSKPELPKTMYQSPNIPEIKSIIAERKAEGGVVGGVNPQIPSNSIEIPDYTSKLQVQKSSIPGVDALVDALHRFRWPPYPQWKWPELPKGFVGNNQPNPVVIREPVTKREDKEKDKFVGPSKEERPSTLAVDNRQWYIQSELQSLLVNSANGILASLVRMEKKAGGAIGSDDSLLDD